MPGNTDVPEVPAPPNALTMKCSEFNKLDEATQLAVIRAILAEENNRRAPRPRCVGQMHGRAAMCSSCRGHRQRGGARRIAAVSG